ncbi:hypothetical protein SAMN05519103_05778 [Rhizobiales bacterium GAS113]|nr:hypothetical protein SAMN05519103_05778 [Rhizobiales bacterium GAS113]
MQALAGRRHAAEGAGMRPLPLRHGNQPIAFDEDLLVDRLQVGEAGVEGLRERLVGWPHIDRSRRAVGSDELAMRVDAGLDVRAVAREFGMDIFVDRRQIMVVIQSPPEVQKALMHGVEGGHFGAPLLRLELLGGDLDGERPAKQDGQQAKRQHRGADLVG